MNQNMDLSAGDTVELVYDISGIVRGTQRFITTIESVVNEDRLKYKLENPIEGDSDTLVLIESDELLIALHDDTETWSLHGENASITPADESDPIGGVESVPEGAA